MTTRYLMRFFLALFLITYMLSAENNNSGDAAIELNNTSVTEKNSTKAVTTQSVKPKKPNYLSYYALKRGKVSQRDLFGKWIDVPVGEKRDPYNSDVVDAITQEIDEMKSVKFIGRVKIYKLRINKFSYDDKSRSISYKAKILKSYIPEEKSGDIEFDLILDTDEKFNPEKGSDAIIVLTNETGIYHLDQFMVLPPQIRLKRSIVRRQAKEKIHNIMLQELKDGYSIENVTKETVKPTHKLNKQYIGLLETYLDEALEKSDYNFPSKKRFAKKVKKIFDITLTQQEQIHTSSCAMDENPKTKYLAHSIDTNRTIFLKDSRFIMFAERFPMLIDYRKDADLNTTIAEKQGAYTDNNKDTFIVTTWQDVYEKNMTRGGTKTLVRLNKYLFNSDKQYLNWLFDHEPEFMSSLVTTYGYRGDKRLLKKVISSRDTNSSISLDGLIYFKTCKRGVSSDNDRGFFIFDETFKYLNKKLGDEKYARASENKYLKELDRILKSLGNNDELWMAQNNKVRNKIEDLIQKHLKPAPIENSTTTDQNITQELNATYKSSLLNESNATTRREDSNKSRDKNRTIKHSAPVEADQMDMMQEMMIDDNIVN